jgi:hypothetical protein
MIVESFKIVASLWPLVKEAFLWRDGAEIGKPITEQNLIRRKIAVFALVGSVLLNYLAVSRFIDQYKETEAKQEKIASLTEDNLHLRKKLDDLRAKNSMCVSQEQLSEILRHDREMIENYCLPPKRKKTQRKKTQPTDTLTD